MNGGESLSCHDGSSQVEVFDDLNNVTKGS